MQSAFQLLLLALSAAPALSAPSARATKAKTLVDPSLFNDFVHYGSYCATYPEAPCQIPPNGTVVQGYANSDITATEMTLFRSDSYKELVMAFPGTSSIQDFLTDLDSFQVPYLSAGINCTACKVHAGVLVAWNSIQKDSKKVMDCAIKEYPAYKVILAGHSLGAAITGFAFNCFVSQGYNIHAAYAYGEFRIGNQAFADLTDKLSGSTDEDEGNYYRVTHANDGVPQAVPQSEGYVHSRTEYWEMDGPNGEVPTAATTYRCYGQEPSDCNDSAGGVGINEAHITYPGINVTGCGGFGPLT